MVKHLVSSPIFAIFDPNSPPPPPPPFLFPLLEFQKKISPINMSRLKSWSPCPFQREGGGNYVRLLIQRYAQL